MPFIGARKDECFVSCVCPGGDIGGSGWMMGEKMRGARTIKELRGANSNSLPSSCVLPPKVRKARYTARGIFIVDT